jgi:hypothetical protein
MAGLRGYDFNNISLSSRPIVKYLSNQPIRASIPPTEQGGSKPLVNLTTTNGLLHYRREWYASIVSCHGIFPFILTQD